jgi:hypothetical protein
MDNTTSEDPELDPAVAEILAYWQSTSTGEASLPRGRPDDFPGVEIQSILRTPGGRLRAGKSYRPDPTRARRAVKVDDYKLGSIFLHNPVVIDCLEPNIENGFDISTSYHSIL